MRLIAAGACLVVALGNFAPSAAAQERGGRAAGLGADPMAGPIVTASPFSADATTTVTQTLGDGTRIEQQATARFYRDSAGRVRREQTIIGLDALNASAPPRTVITFDSVPADPQPFTLDPVRKTAARTPRGLLGAGLSTYFLGDSSRRRELERAVDALTVRQLLTDAERGQLRELERALNLLQNQPAGPVVRSRLWYFGNAAVGTSSVLTPPAALPSGLTPTVEQLGTRQMDSVKATGRRTTVIIPTDRVGNDRPIQISDEWWESPELGLVVYSRYSDPRTGVIEYRLTNINRTEPSADLFQVPADHTVTGRGLLLPEAGARGQRGGRGQ